MKLRGELPALALIDLFTLQVTRLVALSQSPRDMFPGMHRDAESAAWVARSRWTRPSSQANGSVKPRLVPAPRCGGIERTVDTADDPIPVFTTLVQFAG